MNVLDALHKTTEETASQKLFRMSEKIRLDNVVPLDGYLRKVVSIWKFCNLEKAA